MLRKLDWSLVLAFAIPVLMVLFVAGSIYLPRLFMDPQYDFVYAVGEGYYGNRYSIVDGKIIFQSDPGYEDLEPLPLEYPQYETKLYYHDIQTNQSRELSMLEAESLNINSNAVSPDGYEVVPGSRGDGFLLFYSTSSDYSKVYIKGKGGSMLLNAKLTGNYYNGFQFLGWVDPN